MLKNYLIVAVRNIIRQKAYSFINIAGLALGMAGAILILLWVQDELSYDKFHEYYNDLHLVGLEQQFVTRTIRVSMTPAPLAQALKEEFPEIVNATRIRTRGSTLFTHGDKRFIESEGAHVDPSFLEMFSFPLIAGNPKTALMNPYSIILTEKLAKKYFANEDPIGKIIKYDNKFDIMVTGVMKNYPENSSLKYNFLIPFEFLTDLGWDLSSWQSNSFYTYVQVQKNFSDQLFSDAIRNYYLNRFGEEQAHIKPFLYAFKNTHLYSIRNTGGDIRYVRIFTLVALFVLIIAAINYMNLATARHSQRAKEIALRKVVGANKSQMIRQILGESIFMTLIALAISLLLVEILLPVFNELSGKNISLSVLKAEHSLIIIGTILFTGFLSGSYPALFLSSLTPAQILKKYITYRSTGSSFRKILVVTQFSLSIILIIATIIVYYQLDYIHNKNLGYKTENLIYVPIRGNIVDNFEALRKECLKYPSIQSMTMTADLPTLIGSNGGGWDWEGKNPNENVLMGVSSFSYDLLETFDMKMVAGRYYSREYPSDQENSIVLNEAAVKVMEMEAPIGKRFTEEKDYTIIGVIHDFHFKSLHMQIEPLVLFYRPEWYEYIFLKIHSNNIAQTVGFIENVFKKFNPDYPFEYRFLDEEYGKLYNSEQRMGQLFKYFSLFAILISCLGLFGLASFMTEQRTKEIGIRKVLGADVLTVTVLFSKEFTKWVLTANLIAWPVSYLAMNAWLKDFAYHIQMEWWVFILAASLALIIALVTVSSQTLKAAFMNPVKALRYE